jgi:hypothetical protein
MSGHGIAAIEIGEHDRRRISVRDPHVRNQRGEHRRPREVRQCVGRCGHRNGQDVARDTQPVHPEGRLIDHRPGTQQSPIQVRPPQPLEVALVRPIDGLHRRHVDRAATRRVEIEERRARQEPGHRLFGDGQQVQRGDESVDQGHEGLGVPDMAGAIDEDLLSAEHVRRQADAEIARVQRDARARFGIQLRRRAHDRCHRVAGVERLAQHVPTERPRRAQDDETSHDAPHADPGPGKPGPGPG